MVLRKTRYTHFNPIKMIASIFIILYLCHLNFHEEEKQHNGPQVTERTIEEEEGAWEYIAISLCRSHRRYFHKQVE